MKTAIVHDWLITYGGAERVLEQMLKVFPDADLFALYDFIPEGKRDFIQNKPVTTSFLQKFPFARKKYRSYLPFMPLAVEQFDLSAYELIISSSFAVAKGVITGPDQLHICICYSPPRYAYDLTFQYLDEAGLRTGIRGAIAKLILHYIRNWDYRTAAGVDQFVAISEYIARRIEKIYRRDSKVIYPPVDTESFRIGDERGDFYLTASRMVPYKKIGLIVEAFAQMPEKQLFVIGDGPEFSKIKKKATENIFLLGFHQSDVLREYLQNARAFVFAAEEDFGILPLEAQACGTPVIAFGRGGALETVIENRTGIFFRKQTVEAIIDAVKRFETMESRFDRKEIRAHAERFSVERFQAEFRAFVEKAIGDFHERKGKKLQGEESKSFPKLQLRNRLKNQTTLDLP